MTHKEKLKVAYQFLTEGAWYDSCCLFSRLINERSNYFNKRISEVFKDSEILIISVEAKKDYNRFKHIVSIGDTWNDDEILLLMSIRTNLELLKNYFEFSNLEFPNLDLTALDESLAALRDSKLNKKDYYFALSLMDKNGPAISREILPR